MNSTLFSNIFVLILIIIQLFAPVLVDIFPIPIITLQAISGVVFLLIPSIIYIFATKQNFKTALSIKPLGIKNILLLFAFGLLIQPSMGLLAGISSFVFPNDISNVIETLNALPLIYALLIVAISPAICEELAFRGAFASGYKNTNIKKAALMNGLMFGFLHLDGQQFLYAFVMGIVFCYIVHITESIFSSMLIHFVFNGTQLLLARVSTTITSDPVATQAALGMSDTQLLLASISMYTLLTAATIPFLYIIFKALIDINKKDYETIVLDQNCENLTGSMIVASTTQTYDDDYEITFKKPIALSNEKVLNWPVFAIAALYVYEIIIPIL